MSYVKAVEVLPEEVLELIQKYVEGEYIYIPRKECNRKAWGEITKSKQETLERNQEIFRSYMQGASARELAEMYFLSLKSIQRIILNIKKENQ